MDRGQVIVFTGDGKGKTSAAMGTVMRAAGHKMYVSVLQFIKKPQAGGEGRAAERLAPEVEFLSMGKGFVNLPGDAVPVEEHRAAARTALERARQLLSAGSWDLVVLDEINNAVDLGLLDIADVLALVRMKPHRVNLILTGRNAHPDLMALADTVTEMRDIKHPHASGARARRGIDY